MGVDVAGAITEIGGNVPLHERAIDLVPQVIHLFHNPNAPRNGDFVAHRRWFHDSAQLFGTGAHGVFDILLENGVEFVVVDDAFTGQPDNEPAVFGSDNVVFFKQMQQQTTVVVLCDAVETGKGQHT